MPVRPVDYRYDMISPVTIRVREDQATLEIDPWYEEVFGRCPVLVELEEAHLRARWERVARRWKAKHR